MTHGREHDAIDRRIPIGLMLCGLALALSGCRQPPLRATDPRSQFDHYDLSRDEQEPAYWFDEYGRRQPNLRGRLQDDR